MCEQAFKNIDDVLWKDAGCTSELDYTEQSSWLLFVKNPNGGEEFTHHSPQEIMEEITAPDQGAALL